MGVVWRAIQLSTNREVAIKVIRPDGIDNFSALKLFRQEVNLISKLEHPNIARIYDSGIHRLDYFFAMELIHGDGLLSFIRERNLSQHEMLSLIAKICHAVEFAHSHGVIHGDIKPSNILVTTDGEAHVLDFGLATSLDAPRSNGRTAGTLPYMAPEQIRGETCRQTDIFAIGVILYELLVGRLPRELPTSRKQALDVIEASKATWPPETASTVRKDLQAIVLKSLSPDLEHRYDSCLQLATDITRFQSGKTVSACSYSYLGYINHYLCRHQRKLWVAVVAIVGLGAAISTSHRHIQALNDRITEETNQASMNRYLEQIHRADEALNRNDIALAKSNLASCPEHFRNWEWYRLWKLADQSDLSIADLKKPIVAAMPRHDSNQIMVLDRNGVITTYDRTTGTELQSCKLDGPAVMRAVFCQPPRLITKSHDGKIRMWNTNSGREIPISPGRADHRYANIFHAAGQSLALIEPSGLLVVRDLESSQILMRRRAPEAAKYVRCSLDGKRVVAVGRTVKVWDVRTDTESEYIPDPHDAVSALALGDDGERMALAYRSGSIEIYDLLTTKKIQSLQGSDDFIRAIEFGRNQNEIVTAGNDGAIRYWNLATRKVALTMTGHMASVRFMKHDTNRQELISFDADQVLKVWHPQRIEALTTRLDDSNMDASTFDPTGQYVAWCGLNREINLWDRLTPNTIRKFTAHDKIVQAVAMSQDGKRLVSGGQDQVLRVWNTESGIEEKMVQGYRGKLFKVAIRTHPHRMIIAMTTQPDGIWIWKAESDQTPHFLEGRYPFAWSIQGDRLAFARSSTDSPAESLIVWNLVSGREEVEIQGQGNRLSSIAFSHDDQRLASSYQDGSIGLWDLQSGQRLWKLQPDTNTIAGSLAFSPDDLRLATAGNSVKLWDTVTGHQVYTVSGKSPEVFRSVGFSRDGSTLMAGSVASVTIWRVE